MIDNPLFKFVFDAVGQKMIDSRRQIVTNTHGHLFQKVTRLGNTDAFNLQKQKKAQETLIKKDTFFDKEKSLDDFMAKLMY